MRTRTVFSTALAAGLMATALIATPALAGNGSGSGAGDPADCSASDTAGRMLGSASRSAGRMGAGSGSTATGSAASGTVTAAQEADLAAMAEEEKLAHDLYLAFAESYDVRVFTRVAASETRHLEAVQSLLVGYGIDDPTTGQAAGEFSTEATQELYDELLAQGAASLDAAYEAARTVESTDITDLPAAADGVTAPDVLAVYDHLLTGSTKHLDAFGG